MITVTLYTSENAEVWNRFISASNNGTFLFDRRFMEYHADRFFDHSLIFFQDDKLIAVLPADKTDTQLRTHGGLTYGGFALPPRCSGTTVLALFDALVAYAEQAGFESILYKPVPSMYHVVPNEAERYALFRHDARLVQVDLSTAVWLPQPQKISASRRQSTNKALKAGLGVSETDNWPRFWGLLAQVLAERHGATPTHTLAEIEYLAQRFPNNIRLLEALDEAQNIHAGAVVFDCGATVHAQYLAASPEGRDNGALNAVILDMLQTRYADRRWFDFGISTEDAGWELNSGLLRQKEMFGGSALTYEKFEIAL